MDLIIGGSISGKADTGGTGVRPDAGDICDLAAGEPVLGARCYIHLEELTRRQEDTESLSPLLTAAEVVIAREIGSGVVPMDAGERAWRGAMAVCCGGWPSRPAACAGYFAD